MQATFAAILSTIIAFATNIKAISAANRVIVLSFASLVMGVLGIWAFFRHPQGLIVVVLAAISGHFFGPTIVDWVRGKPNL